MKHVYVESELSGIAAEVLSFVPARDTGATVLALSGSLGAGKTTLTKAIGQKLGITDVVVSPTFVIAKWYTPTTGPYTTVVHIDAYRIEDESELTALGFTELLTHPKTLVIIEWPERLPNALRTVPLCLFLLDHHGEHRSIEGPLSYERIN